MKDSKNKPTSSQQDYHQELFPLVGIAASAGGLEAFTDLLKHLPTDTGMAFVLIQHLDPNYKNLLSEILARTTQMPVREVSNGMTVEPNQVYVIPPNTKMTLAQGVLQLGPREKIHGKYMPADAFLASLAAERGRQALGVVLSGTDGDGALGVAAIKAAGGITFAQCEVSAKFDSMPSTAVTTGQVDFILPPEQIALELAKISRHPYVTLEAATTTVEEPSNCSDALTAIFAMLRTATKVDFTYYKRTTVNRRLGRRMLLYKLERLEDYARYLREHPAEVKALYQELLISVTNFFRDPEAFVVLKLLDISRITTGKLQLNVSAIALAPVIEAAINVARLSAEAKNIQVEAVIPAETIEVSGDPDRLQQVIWNLLSNAIKFTPVGGQVTVKLERTGEIALIQVSDTGIGISLDFLPYVFERFRQADSSRTRAQGGLGLSLLQQCPESSKHLIASIMTVLVIDLLEVVQIQNDKAQRLTLALSQMQQPS